MGVKKFSLVASLGLLVLHVAPSAAMMPKADAKNGQKSHNEAAVSKKVSSNKHSAKDAKASAKTASIKHEKADKLHPEAKAAPAEKAKSTDSKVHASVEVDHKAQIK